VSFGPVVTATSAGLVIVSREEEDGSRDNEEFVAVCGAVVVLPFRIAGTEVGPRVTAAGGCTIAVFELLVDEEEAVGTVETGVLAAGLVVVATAAEDPNGTVSALAGVGSLVLT